MMIGVTTFEDRPQFDAHKIKRLAKQLQGMHCVLVPKVSSNPENPDLVSSYVHAGYTVIDTEPGELPYPHYALLAISQKLFDQRNKQGEEALQKRLNEPPRIGGMQGEHHKAKRQRAISLGEMGEALPDADDLLAEEDEEE